MTRYTISQLADKAHGNYLNDIELLKDIVRDRKSKCTNYYSPLYKRLSELEEKLSSYTESNKNILRLLNGDIKQ